jgi:hypothetical protein
VGAGELLIVHDHDADYGVAVGTMCDEAAKKRGLTVRTRPVWNHDEPWAEDVAEADAVLYVGVAGSGAIGLWRDLHGHDTGMWLLGSEGVAEEWLAQGMDASAAERTRFFVAQRAPFALYGYEAMALVLDAIERAGDEAEDRRAVRDELLATTDRDSVLGTYSITPLGNTTLEELAGYRIRDGELVFDRSLEPR